jgi:hypothetical protein
VGVREGVYYFLSKLTLHSSFSFQLLKPLGFEVVVSRTFNKNLRSRGNPFSLVPQVLNLLLRSLIKDQYP